MAQYILDLRQNYRVFFLPCAFRKDKILFASNKHRLEMLKISIEKYFRINPLIIDSSKDTHDDRLVSDLVIDKMEIANSDVMIPTSEILKQFDKSYSNHENYMMIGTDILNSITEWEEYATVLKPRKFIVFDRDAHSNEEEAKKKVLSILPNSIYIHKVTTPEISSSKIRLALGSNKSLSRKKLELKKYTLLSVI